MPLPPEWLQINGQTLINSGVINADGSVWGLTVVSAPSGATVDVTPTVTQTLINNDYTFRVEVGGLQIVDANTGAILTGQTNNVIVGQQVNLKCQLMVSNEVITVFPLANFQWTVPGYAISNYVVAADSSSAMVATNFSTNHSNVVFYWVDGASNRVVQCSATAQGKTFTAQTTFNIYRPSVVMVNPAVHGLPENLWLTGTPPWTGLEFGEIGLGIAGTTNNMSYYVRVISSESAGDAKITQLCTIDATHYPFDINVTGELDNSDPYGADVQNPSSVHVNKTPNPQGAINEMSLDDAPSDGGFGSFHDNSSYVDYIMFNPDPSGSGIYVPLGKVTWSTSFAATYPSPAINPNLVNGPTNPDGSVDFPRWTVVFSNNN